MYLRGGGGLLQGRNLTSYHTRDREQVSNSIGYLIMECVLSRASKIQVDTIQRWNPLQETVWLSDGAIASSISCTRPTGEKQTSKHVSSIDPGPCVDHVSHPPISDQPWWARSLRCRWRARPSGAKPGKIVSQYEHVVLICAKKKKTLEYNS